MNIDYCAVLWTALAVFAAMVLVACPPTETDTITIFDESGNTVVSEMTLDTIRSVYEVYHVYYTGNKPTAVLVAPWGDAQ